ncbi:MAG: hypothetical protein EXQ70_09275 [Solirubrobacterales bacterium]|nr:hypothetical protein [Solirubrobacterales bacterium]
MSKAIRGAARRLLHSAPGAVALVIVACIGVGYAATSDKSGNGSGDSAAVGQAPPGPPGLGGALGAKLSDEDRQALEKFGECMRDEVGPPPQLGRGDAPDPSEAREKSDAAYEKCKGELPENLQNRFEQRQAQQEKFQQCMEDQGVEPPDPGQGGPPSKADLQELEDAMKACADELPKGAAGCGPIGPGGPPPGGAGFTMPTPPPRGADGSDTEGGHSDAVFAPV